MKPKIFVIFTLFVFLAATLFSFLSVKMVSAAEDVVCEGAIPQQLHKGDEGQVTFISPQRTRLRKSPVNGDVELYMPPGHKFTVTGDPQCHDGQRWFPLTTKNDSGVTKTGWSSEGKGIYQVKPWYYIEPLKNQSGNKVQNPIPVATNLPPKVEVSQQKTLIHIAGDGSQMIVFKNAVPAYSGPNESYNRAGTTVPGTGYKLIGRNANLTFVQIETNGIYAWVRLPEDIDSNTLSIPQTDTSSAQ